MKLWEFLLRLPLYKLYKHVELPGVLPFSYVLLLSNKCNSRCKTCGLWKKSNKDEMSTNEWMLAIKKLGNAPVWVTVTGGEPFFLDDIDLIVSKVKEFNNPRVICIPSNGSMPNIIEKKVSNILNYPRNPELIINLSVDDIGEKHDKLRGVPGGFAKLEETVKRLKRLQAHHKNLKIGVNTVISQHNIDSFFNIYNYVVNNLKPDDYIFEPAQQRAELNTTQQDFRMDKHKLSRILKFLATESKTNRFHKRGISFVKNSIRLRYYKSLLEPKKAKCNAGLLSCQLMPNGKVVACGVKGLVLGSLREHNLNLKELWREAAPKRVKLRHQKCSCQLANIFYVNRF